MAEMTKGKEKGKEKEREREMAQVQVAHVTAETAIFGTKHKIDQKIANLKSRIIHHNRQEATLERVLYTAIFA